MEAVAQLAEGLLGRQDTTVLVPAVEVRGTAASQEVGWRSGGVGAGREAERATKRIAAM